MAQAIGELVNKRARAIFDAMGFPPHRRELLYREYLAGKREAEEVQKKAQEMKKTQVQDASK